METTERVVNGLTILRVRGRLAASPEDTDLETFNFALTDLIARGCVDIGINLEAVKLVDAEGLGELACLHTCDTARRPTGAHRAGRTDEKAAVGDQAGLGVEALCLRAGGGRIPLRTPSFVRLILRSPVHASFR